MSSSSSAVPPRIPGSAMFKSLQTDIAKIEELLGEAVSQIGWKNSVRVATTANITLSGVQTIDGIAVVAEDLVLVKDQTDGEDNGIYVCKADAWERSETMLVGTVASGAACYVLLGTVGAGKIYICTDAPAASVVGTDALTFAIFVSGPAGSDTQVQFNDAGVMGGDSGLTFNKTTDALTVVGNVVVSTATAGLNLTKLTGTVSSLSGTATIVARQGIITVTNASLGIDSASNLRVTATGMVGADNLIIVAVNSMVSSDGAPVLNVSARTPPNQFTITITNCDGATPMAASAITIGYVIL